MSCNHLIFCCPLLLPPSIFPSIRIFSNESALRIRWSQYWSFNFSTSPSSEYSGLISFRMDWLDLLAVQGTLERLLQHHSSKVSIFRHSLLLLTILFSYLFLAALGLCCCMQALSSCREQELLRDCSAQASLCSGFSCCEARAPGHAQPSVAVAPGLSSRGSLAPDTGSIVVVHRISCSTASGIFLDQGSNPCLLHRQMDSLPLSHQGSPAPRNV